MKNIKFYILGFLLTLISFTVTINIVPEFLQGSLFHFNEIQDKRNNSKFGTLSEDLHAHGYDTDVISCDVLIAGGGVSGTAAAIQAGRMGVDTCLIEETNWLGGMLSSAGVSAIDGHPDIASGIFKEFVTNIRAYYASKSRLQETQKCSVSYLCFEPSVANYVLQKMVEDTPNIRLFTNAEILKVYKNGDNFEGIRFAQDEKQYIAKAKVTIDATEFGDLMYLADIPYSLGVDEDSTEKHANLVEECIQPITHVAILRKVDERNFHGIEMPENYDRSQFSCTVENKLCPVSNSKFDLKRLQTYGALPNNQLMINIPSHSYGNDFNASDSDYKYESRDEIIERAKDYTRQYVYFLQSELGLKYELTGLAKIPYVRESRRLEGVYRMVEDDVRAQADIHKFFKNSIAIGDYPIDIHYCSYGRGDLFIPVHPYQIPVEVLIPKTVDGFLVAEKNISVSHIVNGTTRLQPVVMSIGQASGALAALSVIDEKDPRDVDIERLQTVLLNSDARIVYFKDMNEDHFAYPYVAKVALKGIVHGFSDYSFKPDNAILKEDLIKVVSQIMIEADSSKNWNEIIRAELANVSSKYITRAQMAQLIVDIKYRDYTDIKKFYFNDIAETSPYFKAIQTLANEGVISVKTTKFRPNNYITRAEAITMIVRSIGI